MKSGERIEPESGRPSRGQTTIDFTIGISIFLAVVLFVFLFVPGILEPFTGSAQEETVSTNRVADQLTKGMIGSPRQPYVLEEYCTVQFFNNSSASGCNFESKPVERQFGFDPDRQNVNITVNEDGSTASQALCWNETRERFVEMDSDCDVPLIRGDDLPTHSSPTVSAHRVVSLNGRDVTVYVEMW